MAFRRRKIPRGKSRRSFSRGASRTNRRNVSSGPMRGGIRL